MIFSKENAGKWVASKEERVIATSKNLKDLMQEMHQRKDRDAIQYDLVPPHLNYA